MAGEFTVRITIAIAASLALVSGAAAQPGWYAAAPSAPLAPSYVKSVLRAAGLRPASEPVLYGDRYVVRAIDPNGGTRRVVVDAEFGDIIRISAAQRRESASRFPWAAPRRWWEGDVSAVRPPAPIRGGRREGARTAAADPTQRSHPPVPRARPMTPPAAAAAQEPSAPAEATADTQGSAAQPQPTRPEPKEAAASDTGKPDTAALQTGSVNPTLPDKAETAAPDKQSAETPQRTASPRVILPGGPAPKAERGPEPEAGDAETSPPSAQASETARGAEALPPVQPLE